MSLATKIIGINGPSFDQVTTEELLPKTMESQKMGANTTHSMCTALLYIRKIVAWILFFVLFQKNVQLPSMCTKNKSTESLKGWGPTMVQQ